MSRSKNYDNELLRVFIQTGLLPSLVTASMVVLFCWSILCRCAWSSDRKLLYYLDAISEERERLARNMLEIPTIPTIIRRL